MSTGTSLTIIEGSCHCGNLSFEFASPQTAENLTLRECQCSFCRLHGAVTAREPDGHAHIRARDPGCMTLYRFGTRSTDFVLCGACGAYLGAVIAVDGKQYATLNMRLTSLDLSRAEPIVYDDEPVEQRVARRIQLFTPLLECPF